MKCYVLDGEWAPRPGYVLKGRELKDARRAINASTCYKNAAAKLEDRPMPTPADNEVLIRMGACGICGSDVHAVGSAEDGYSAYANHLRLPVILGHEFSGEVVEVGKDVTTVKVGDLIAVEQIHWCGECPACRIGKFNQCYNMEELGLSKDGGFAEYIRVPEKYCCLINDLATLYGDKGQALEAGALVEPTAVAYSGMFINGGGLKPGSHVVVYGAGPIGLVSVGLAKAAGAAKIFCIARNPERLAIAKQMGADYILNVNDLPEGVTPSSFVMEKTNGIGAAMIVEATGAYESVYPEIEAMMAIGANIIQLGVGTGQPDMNVMQYLRSNSRIQGSLGHAGSDIFPSVVRMMESGRIDMRPIITARFKLDDVEKAFELATKPGQGKIVVTNY